MGLRSIFDKGERTVVGLMSGTSMDGIDAAAVRIRGSGYDSSVEFIDFLSLPYDESMREGLSALLSVGGAAEVGALDFLVGEAFGSAAVEIMNRAGLGRGDVDLIGSHGQTVCHNPPSSGKGTPYTLQLGDLDVIAKMTGITTVGDFRPADMAVGGEGAPVVAYVDFLLFHSEGGARIAQNIGGIANAAAIGESLSGVIAFDTGPGNMLMDCAVRLATRGGERYDRDGAYARAGRVDHELLESLLRDPFFAKPPPKSTGAELFGMEMAERLYASVRDGGETFEDLMRTLLELTVESIARAYERFIFPAREVGEAILSGGGALNPLLLERLGERLRPLRVVKSDAYGIPAEAKEAIAVAVLANELIAGNNANIISVTGARKCVPLGKIALGGTL